MTREFTHEFLTEELDLPYACIDSEFLEEHRWYDLRLGIFEVDGVHYGIEYADLKTEMQEGMDPFEIHPNPVTVKEVEQVEVVRHEWKYK